MNHQAEFDRHADTYDADLNRALSASGEDKTYFSRNRVEWLARSLRQLNFRVDCAVDYGCGIGDTVPLLNEVLNARTVIGLDPSSKALQHARARYESEPRRFYSFEQYQPSQTADLVYCNGVFHHIPLSERADAVQYIQRCLRPGGIFALWENNPWNPGARHVMAQCVFDRDAVPISPPNARSLLQAGGFHVLQTRFAFIFPKALKALRFLESPLSPVPLGAQYLVLARKA